MTHSVLPPGSFLGENRPPRRAGGFTLCESHYATGQRIPVHAHERAFFYFVLSGNSTERYSGRTRTASAGTLVFHPPGESHSNQWHSTGHCLHLELTPATLVTARELGAALDRPVEFRSGWPVWLAGRIQRELSGGDPGSALALEGLGLELLAEVCRPERPAVRGLAPGWLGEAREVLHTRFAESISLGDVAAAVGVHASHLARVFRREMGCSVGDYVRTLRVEYACREIAAGGRPLTEIALAAGFSDQSHLTRCVRRETGLTPAAFRRRFGRNAGGR